MIMKWNIKVISRWMIKWYLNLIINPALAVKRKKGRKEVLQFERAEWAAPVPGVSLHLANRRVSGEFWHPLIIPCPPIR